MNRLYKGLTVLSFGLMLLTPDAVPGLGEEKFGPGPISSAANYPDWDGIMPLIEHETRVYYSWVNGGERLYYSGSQEQLEEFLRLFATVNSPMKEVRLHPGTGMAESFNRERTFTHGWSLRIDGGLVRHMAGEETETAVLEDNPVVHVYTGAPGVDLETLAIPDGVVVVGLADQKDRLRAGLASEDPQIRSLAMMDLARLDPHDADSARAIQALAADPDESVRSQVPRALELMNAIPPGGAIEFRAGAARIEAYVAARR